jgi:predicted benzoate:H+ symporter BenE
MLERGRDAHRANAAMLSVAAQKAQFLPLPRPANLGAITVADVYAAIGPDEHRDVVRRWAAAVWQAWTPCHAVVRAWVDGIFPGA